MSTKNTYKEWILQELVFDISENLCYYVKNKKWWKNNNYCQVLSDIQSTNSHLNHTKIPQHLYDYCNDIDHIKKCNASDCNVAVIFRDFRIGYSEYCKRHMNLARHHNSHNRDCNLRVSKKMYESDENYVDEIITPSAKRSKGELELQSYIEKILYKSNFNCKIIPSTRSIIGPQEIDIYLPLLNIAFEYNGEYWHQEGINKPIGYHKNKTIDCKYKDITLYHIWERYWTSKNVQDQYKIKAMVRNVIIKHICQYESWNTTGVYL